MSGRTRFFVKIADDFRPDKVFNVDNKRLKADIMSNVFVSAEEQKKIQRGIDGGLYVGTYGNCYTFYHLSKKANFSSERSDLLRAGVELIKTGLGIAGRMKSRDPSDHCGFLLGKAGIYAVGAAIFHEVGSEGQALEECIKKYIEAGNYCSTLTYANFGGDELFVGRAGYLCGALWLNRVLGRQVISDKILHTICNTIVESGRNYSQTHRSKSPLMFHYYNTEYLGAAHGLCSILQMIISCDSYLATNPEAEKDVKHSVDYMLDIQLPNGNFPCATDEIGQSRGRDELVHWCHGAPGVVYLMLKAYIKWKDEKYLNSAIQCGELVWEKGLLKKGPGICHGIGGNGYVFLVLYRVTSDPKYLYRANEFAKFLESAEFKKAKTPDNPYSLYEGIAGTICFLADLMEPETAAFPFMEIM